MNKSTIEAAINQQYGWDVKLFNYPEDGYYFFYSEDPEQGLVLSDLPSTSVHVASIDHLSLSQWLTSFEMLFDGTDHDCCLYNRPLVFRQPLFDSDGNFEEWHEWGWVKGGGGFIGPLHPPKGYVRGFQFTGRNDADGNKIYEGDFVQRGQSVKNNPKPTISRVTFWKGAFYLTPYLSLNLDSISDVRVVGNVIETPDLIKGEEKQ